MYEKARIGVDPVIFTISENKLKVLLQLREKDPFKGKYELPGGLIEVNENAKDVLKRKLKELLDTDKFFFKQFHTFTNPKRDPRIRTISISYITLVGEKNIKDLKNWVDIDEITDQNFKSKISLGFDHREIINKAYEYLKENLNSEIVKHFLPEKFPLNDLQAIHEVILKKTFDNRNFRKQMINSGIVKETKELEKDVSHRPAKLYLFN